MGEGRQGTCAERASRETDPVTGDCWGRPLGGGRLPYAPPTLALGRHAYGLLSDPVVMSCLCNTQLYQADGKEMIQS
jgi:hypothetical protein